MKSRRISDSHNAASSAAVAPRTQSGASTAPAASPPTESRCEIEARREGDKTLVLSFRGRLDLHTAVAAWTQARRELEGRPPAPAIALPLPSPRPPSPSALPARLVIEAGGIEYCDGAGIALFVDLRRRMASAGGQFEIRGLAEKFERLLDLFPADQFAPAPAARPQPVHLPEEVGRATHLLWNDTRALVAYVGELSHALAHAAKHPRGIRWADAFLAAEHAGVNALPIVSLIGFLVGLIMAFQSAMPMKQFGAEIFVANLIGLSMIRELGPLMTSIILAGRSGSSFAAELGTMKVNEEISAIVTMGLEPVRFLVVTRVMAAMLMAPILSIFCTLAGLIGGAIVLLSLGYPLVTYMNQVLQSVDLSDLFGGLFKTLVFGLLVGGVGCLRGLQTRTGASAVGLSATSAVVSGILLIAIADGIFSVAYYCLGI